LLALVRLSRRVVCMQPALPLDHFDSEGGFPAEACPPATDCRKLWVAVLRDVFTVKKNRHSVYFQAQYERDRLWVSADRDEPGSFVWLCGQLGVSPEWIRHAYFSDSVRRLLYL
jgi:hypothetical protein